MTDRQGVGSGWRATLKVLGRMPQGAMSRAFGRVADVHVPRVFRSTLFGTFARLTGIDVSEMAHAIETYPTLDAFFVRTLAPGRRTWPTDPDEAGSPVDGVVGRAGRIEDGTLLQAKGRTYGVAALLDDPEEVRRYADGWFLTLYLSPRHYHRIHAPTAGIVAKARHVPGRLLPVNDAAVRQIPDLFPRNERLITWLDGRLGRIAVVAVGAYNVGRISAAFDPLWGGAAVRGAVTNRAGARPTTRTYDGIEVAMGAELMAFHLGSTVVLLFEKGVAPASLETGAEIRLGAPIARATHAGPGT